MIYLRLYLDKSLPNAGEIEAGVEEKFDQLPESTRDYTELTVIPCRRVRVGKGCGPFRLIITGDTGYVRQVLYNIANAFTDIVDVTVHDPKAETTISRRKGESFPRFP